MDPNALFAALLGPLLYATPQLLLCAVGLVLCLIRRRALGAAGVYGSVGFALFILGSLLGICGQVWLMWVRQNGEINTSSLAISMGAFSTVVILLHAIAMGLVIAAILIRRPTQSA